MCTVTLEYNPHNALARRKLAAPTCEEVNTHRAEMQAFLTHSKKSMANIIARYV